MTVSLMRAITIPTCADMHGWALAPTRGSGSVWVGHAHEDGVSLRVRVGPDALGACAWGGLGNWRVRISVTVMAV